MMNSTNNGARVLRAPIIRCKQFTIHYSFRRVNAVIWHASCRQTRTNLRFRYMDSWSIYHWAVSTL